jgi:hypothetical protein
MPSDVLSRDCRAQIPRRSALRLRLPEISPRWSLLLPNTHLKSAFRSEFLETATFEAQPQVALIEIMK